ncbi:type II toxin-antitoxin system RelE/ParE family toxin [Dyadobacter frigoris]|uniref:Type II toxin-antitoxin system RelE/ParE family toxin n=1 Tax=Dyadobacter frigoris TaxID=2576211 RepID=A0A4U6CTM4_9BACT|nr:type II toxin-antitoxin system RelE/ParE family toxin [Dyadobacter frigoris]TKT86911.1 type II toxin-antitoxin system RelE/ParE family toxin [Dyadobacter frigoris]GLU56586.1 toxin RelE [Dyadobacter frigoris]
MHNFEIKFMEDARQFLLSLDKRHSEKIIYNIRKVQNQQDSGLLKKLKGDIWELRTLYGGIQYRLLAFWDKTDSDNTLVISTHGFIKKQSKVPDKELEKAKQLRLDYFDDNSKNK